MDPRNTNARNINDGHASQGGSIKVSTDPEYADPPRTLLDVQNLKDARGINLQRVGVKQVEIPLRVLQKNGKSQMVAAMATMSVGLAKEFKGTHMSRFIMQLTEWSKEKVLTFDLREFLLEAQQRLQSETAQIELAFRFFMEKASPVTDISAPMAYGCTIYGSSIGTEVHHIVLGVDIPISTLCPCSKAISKYGAHNQRAMIHAKVVVDSESPHPVLWFEDLISALEECSSCPVYPFLKREDEKYVTERQYENPKFVEDVIREATAVLRTHTGVNGFSLEVEALESIHGHNAWAFHEENFQLMKV